VRLVALGRAAARLRGSVRYGIPVPRVQPPVALPQLPAMKLAQPGEIHELRNGHLLDQGKDLPLVDLYVSSTVRPLPRPHREARRSRLLPLLRRRVQGPRWVVRRSTHRSERLLARRRDAIPLARAMAWRWRAVPCPSSRREAAPRRLRCYFDPDGGLHLNNDGDPAEPIYRHLLRFGQGQMPLRRVGAQGRRHQPQRWNGHGPGRGLVAGDPRDRVRTGSCDGRRSGRGRVLQRRGRRLPEGAPDPASRFPRRHVTQRHLQARHGYRRGFDGDVCRDRCAE
jgi:hypothetical protein